MTTVSPRKNEPMRRKRHLFAAGCFILVAVISVIETFTSGGLYAVTAVLAAVVAVFYLARYFGWERVNRIAGIR